MTPEDLRAAGRICNRYAEAIASSLYITMKIPHAQAEINEAKQLAKALYDEADIRETLRSTPD